MRGGRYNWPSFTLDEERAFAEQAKLLNGKNENGSTEDGFENCAVPVPFVPEDRSEPIPEKEDCSD